MTHREIVEERYDLCRYELGSMWERNIFGLALCLVKLPGISLPDLRSKVIRIINKYIVYADITRDYEGNGYIVTKIRLWKALHSEFLLYNEDININLEHFIDYMVISNYFDYGYGYSRFRIYDIRQKGVVSDEILDFRRR